LQDYRALLAYQYQFYCLAHLAGLDANAYAKWLIEHGQDGHHNGHEHSPVASDEIRPVGRVA
jgi:hypothetical protein